MGVFTAIYFQVNWGNFLGLILLGMLLLKGIEYNVNRKLIAYPFLKTRWILLIILIGLGFFRVDIFRDINRADHFSKSEASAYKISVEEFGTTKYGYHRFKAKVVKSKTKDKVKWTTGNALVYWDTALQVLPKLGETYWIKTEFKSIPKPKNPNEFNYKQYLSYYNVYFKAYVKSSASYVSCHEESPWFTRLLNYARHNVQFIFQKFLQDKNAYLIAQALILGGKNSLDEDVKSNFAHTGTLHVLAVSGLHVGIIYLIAQFIAGLIISKRSKKRFVPVLIILACIWFYALVTGFSPSVQRASCMFTLLSLGDLFLGKANGINSLCASAFIMLAYNPYLVVNVGFQLSYAAVLGIMLIQKPIYMLASFSFIQNKYLWMLVDKAWGICCISLAAQLATLPISLFYFGQFPSYFLFSNLFVIPAIFVLVLLAFLLIATAPVSIIAQGIAYVFSIIASAVLYMVNAIAHLPFAYASGLHLAFVHVLILFVVLGFFIRWLHLRTQIDFNIAALFLIAFLVMFNVKYIGQSARTKLYVHSVNRNRVISYLQGNQATIITDSTFAKNLSAQKFYLDPYFRAHYIRIIRKVVVKNTLAAMRMNNDTLQLYTHTTKYPDLNLFSNKNMEIYWLFNRNSFTDTLVRSYNGKILWSGESPFFEGGYSKFPSLDSFAVDMAM
jgi:competence protein ComEC